MKILKGIVGVLCFFALGYYIHTQSHEIVSLGTYAGPQRIARDPAAIKRVYDFSHLDGTALKYASQQRLLDGVRVLQDGSKNLGVELGHFVIKGPNGEKEFACQRYDRVTLSFRGDGIAVAGELPTMEVEGACEIAEDINAIAAIWIPVSRILGEPVADGEFDFRDEQKVRIQFTHVSDSWPTTWQLYSVRLQDLDGAQPEMNIEPTEIRELSRRPILIEFPQ